jgi:small GTP-binding protein
MVSFLDASISELIILLKMEEDRTPDLMLKIILLGNSHVGKTSLSCQYTSWYDELKNLTATVSCEHAKKKVMVDGNCILVDIWDTAGEERYMTFSKVYYRKAMGGLFVFDLTDKSSFETLYKYVKESNSYSESGMVKILVGNKVDLKENREVT